MYKYRNRNAYMKKEASRVISETPQLIKNYRRDDGIWATVVLTDDEEHQLRQSHREQLVEIIKECIEDSKRIAEPNGCIEIFLALFEKRADHIFTVMNNKMTEKVYEARTNGDSQSFPEQIA
ncbi:MAG: DEAD/DEAH box helicase family protein [Deltaproteobacteria bacterium]|nr:DEAD/DEAH box helicase family protein [Deltaproteobacteria bacterium]MBW2308565.1 DEAD/DEAH box helicase family protein [Deltaproteobacteria bacterium]